MITTNNGYSKAEQIQKEEDQQFFSTLHLKSYKPQKSANKRLDAKVNKKYLIIVTISLAAVAISFLYFQSRCITILALQQQKNKEFLKQKMSKQEQLINQNKQTKQQIKVQSQKNEIINIKISSIKQQTTKKENKIVGHLNIIDIEYGSSYETVPLNLLKMQDSKGVASFLYKQQQLIKKRDEFIQQRISFINSKQGFPYVFLAKYNFVNKLQIFNEGLQQNIKDWERLQKRFQISKVKEELPFCVIVPSYNNNANFRIQGNLNSIFTQNYTNYKVVIVNDASTDKGGDIYRAFFKFYKIDKNKYVYAQNSQRVTALQNIYYAAIEQCSKDSINMILDGDDEFIGRNVLNVFNWAFQSKKAGVVYSNFYWYQQPVNLRYGFTQQYTANQKNSNLYRNVPMKFSQLRAFRGQFLHQMNIKDLQDQKGVFYTIAYDMALFLPLMELACGRVQKIEGEFHYLYNVGTGLNDDYLNRGKQLEVDRRVRAQKKYQCFKEFDQRMKK